MSIPLARTLLLSLAPFATASADPSPQDAKKAEVIYSSTLWQKEKYEIEGSYRIERLRSEGGEEETTFILGDGFSTKDGPDLKLVLSPTDVDDVKSKTALKGSLVLGVLKSNRGGARFAVPKGTDLGKYRSVLVHCEEYSVLWGGAPLEAGEVIASGDDWKKKTKKVEGRWEIAKVGKKQIFRLGGDFDTKSAPDLKLVFSPLTVDAATNDNALEGGKIVAPLRSNEGAQEFTLPDGTDLGAYRSVLIHCQEYTKLWGATKLTRS